MIDLTNLKEVTSQEEYDEKLNLYTKMLNQLAFNVKKMYGNPTNYIAEFENIIEAMVITGVISLEFANEKRRFLYKQLNSPTKFREWLSNKLDKFKGTK